MAFSQGNNQGMAVQDLERRFIDLPQHFDKFIVERARKHLNPLTDRFPRGAYPYFQGLEQTMNIFHGTVGEQAGLSNFKQMQLSRVPDGADPGNDACGPFSSKTFEHSFEARSFTGYEGVWESPVICLSDLMFLHQGREQATLMAKQLPVVVQSVWETWTREQVLSFAVAAGNAFIISHQGIDVTASGPRFEYNPYDERDFGDDQGQVPYITFPSDLQIGGLDMSFFDWQHDFLSDECPEAALSDVGGMPNFGLVIHTRDLDHMIQANKALRESWLYAKPEQLIDGYPMKFRNLRNWAIIHDPRQPRFRVHDVTDGVATAKRVLPKIYVPTTEGSRPEANPEYLDAELAVGFCMINESFSTQIPGNVPSLGNAMSFGPIAGLNGQFTWVNEYDKESNPNREKGNYRARFRLFPRPGTFSRNLISFLYSRTPHMYAGPQIRVGEDEEPVASTTLAQDALIGDWDAASRTWRFKLADKLAVTGVPRSVTVTPDGGAAVNAVIIDTVNAPWYTLAFATDVSGDIADFDTDAVVALA